MQLNKRLPTGTRSEAFLRIAHNYSRFNDVWRRTRSRMRDPMDKCWWCKRKFIENEPIALGIRSKGKNVVLCRVCVCQCAQEALGDE